MEIRDGVAKPRDWRKREGCGIWKAEEVDLQEWVDVDQIITGRNESRHKINRFIRKRLGFKGSDPNSGEKLICLKNDSKRIPQFINGTIFKSNSEAEVFAGVGQGGMDTGVLDICYNGIDLLAEQYYPYHCRVTYDKDLPELPRNFRRGLMELDFAYAITCHKSQGSEWESVIVADDKMQANDPVFRRRWLYTAVTRAKSNLMVIQQD
jgi:exodeoxyribonuclease-5